MCWRSKKAEKAKEAVLPRQLLFYMPQKLEWIVIPGSGLLLIDTLQKIVYDKR